MKTGFALLLTFLLVLQTSALQVRAQRNGQGRFGQNRNQGQNNANQNGTGNTTAANNGNNGNNTNNGNNNDSDPQTSLVIDPSVICTACTDDGQNPPVDQQSPSLTSQNNFVNFCQGKTLTNGQQLVDGSCNAVPYGDIIPSSNMPGAKITFPPNGGTFPANQEFTFKMNINNMITGNFVNANTNYYGAPQQLQGNTVIGHTHVTVQLLPSLDSTDPLDPATFAFFKGINGQDANGVLTVDVTNGLPAGVYRFCTINTNANHTPVMVAIAQHGSLDDCTYATAVDGNGNNGGNNNNNNNNGNVADASSTTTAAAAATSTAANAATSSAAGGNQGQGRNRGGQGRNRGGNGRGRGRGRHPHKRETSKVFA